MLTVGGVDGRAVITWCWCWLLRLVGFSKQVTQVARVSGALLHGEVTGLEMERHVPGERSKDVVRLHWILGGVLCDCKEGKDWREGLEVAGIEALRWQPLRKDSGFERLDTVGLRA